jgi:transposase-like protein
MKSVSILFYILGMSYRGVEDMLTALGFHLSFSTVYRNVQAAGKQVRRLKQGEQKISVVGGDLTYVECQGEQATIGVAIDAEQGILLDIDVLDNEETDTIEGWLKPFLESVGAQVLISDDQDTFKHSADAAAVEHQVCRRHVSLNVLEFVAKTVDQVLEKAPAIPADLNVTPDQFLEDLETLEWIMLGHPWNALALLENLFQRYSAAKAPKKNQRASPWYRMRNHVLRLWNHWSRHTCYREFLHCDDVSIDQTNNKTEQIIGWNIKERYRTMRGDKRKQSILNVAMLTSWLRENPDLQDMRLLFTA